MPVPTARPVSPERLHLMLEAHRCDRRNPQQRRREALRQARGGRDVSPSPSSSPVGGLRLHRLATTPPDRVEPHHHPPRSASPPHLPSPAGRRPPSSSDSEDSISLLFNQSGSRSDSRDSTGLLLEGRHDKQL